MFRIFIIFYFVMIFIYGFMTILDGDLTEDYTISPSEIYDEGDLNWFGVILLYLFKILINPFPFVFKFLKFLVTK